MRVFLVALTIILAAVMAILLYFDLTLIWMIPAFALAPLALVPVVDFVEAQRHKAKSAGKLQQSYNPLRVKSLCNPVNTN